MFGLNRGKENADVTENAASQPLLYELRVKGRLSEEQWTSWFDRLTVTTSKGESTLRGRALDHAALYALLSRLRDLAVPLLSVRVLDAKAQRRLYRQRRRNEVAVSAMLVAVYLALLGAMATITVLIAPIIDTALALALLGAALGGVAHAFSTWTGHKAWRWITYVTWPAAVFTFLLWPATSGRLPAAVSIAVILILLGGGLLWLVYYMRGRGEQINGSIVGFESVDSPREPEENRDPGHTSVLEAPEE